MSIAHVVTKKLYFCSDHNNHVYAIFIWQIIKYKYNNVVYLNSD